MAERIIERLSASISRPAQKDVERLDSAIRKQFYERLRELETDPICRDCKKLKGSSKYRARFGDWRIIYVLGKTGNGEKFLSVRQAPQRVLPRLTDPHSSTVDASFGKNLIRLPTLGEVVFGQGLLNHVRQYHAIMARSELEKYCRSAAASQAWRAQKGRRKC